MGHAHSKQRTEIERLVREIKDIESYMKRNSEDFDDECKDNLHKRLIQYSTALQEIFVSAKKKNSKEFRDIMDYINRVVEDIYRPRPDSSSMNNGTIMTVASVHAPPEDSRLTGSSESINKENKRSQRGKKKDLMSHEKYRIPSLEEIKNKTASMKNEVEVSIKNEDVNQLLVQQKIIQILATDLEMLIFEPHSPLQETKEMLEKELSILYRKIEKAKRKSNEAARQRKQKEIREKVDELTDINTKIDQIMSRTHIIIKEKKNSELIEAKDEVIGLKSQIRNISDLSDSIRAMKIELEQKLDKLLYYLNKEIETQQAEISEKQDENYVNNADILTDIAKINEKIDQSMCQAYTLIKERKFFDLVEIKSQVINEKHELDILDKNSQGISDVDHKINDALDFLNKQIEINGVTRKIKKTEQNLERAETLIQACRNDIINFGGMTNKESFDTYNNHLDGLENFYNKITIKDENLLSRKADGLKSISELRRMLKENFEKYNDKKGDKAKDIRDLSTLTPAAKNSNSESALITDSEKLQGRNDVILRKKEKPLKVQFSKPRNIDGFYSYWKDIQSNLPSSNCTYEELQQIAMLLQDLEEQIQAKRLVIENFLQTKSEASSTSKSKESLAQSSDSIFQQNKKFIDSIDGGPVKTNVKIIKTDEPKKLIIDDEEIFQNIDEINQYAKKIEKQTPENVFIPSDSDSSVGTQSQENLKRKEEPVAAIETKVSKEVEIEVLKDSQAPGDIKGEALQMSKAEGKKNKQHIECITQVQNISRDVEYLKEKASSFSDTKQTPRYMDIKNKLDSYRKTLNILISYQNEKITSSCNRVLGSIDEVLEILNKNTEKQTQGALLKVSPKRQTIETLLTELMNTKANIEEIHKEIEQFQDATESDKYVKLRNTLLKNRETLTNMRISRNFENVAFAKAEVLQQIDDGLYDLSMKLEENKIRNKNDLCLRDSKIEKIVNDFQKIKDKVNRFSGTYKNVLYREIEKSIERSLESARRVTRDLNLIQNLNEDAEKYLKILEEKSIKEYSNIDEECSKDDTATEKIIKDKNAAFTEIAVQLSRMRQNLKDIKDNIYSDEPQNVESNKDLEHRINLNILELSSMNITVDEPFYYDKENLRQEFLKLSNVVKDNISALEGERSAGDGQSSSQLATLKTDKNNAAEGELDKIEENVKILRQQIDNFVDEKNSVTFFNIDEGLTRLSMNVDKVQTQKGTGLHKKKVRLLKIIYEACEILENKAQNYELLQNIEKKMIEVKYRLDNFHELSEGDYNALYKELVDLEETLKQLDVSENIAEKKNKCRSNIRECLRRIETKLNRTRSSEEESDGSTEV